MGIHLLRYAHGEERTTLHDALVAIVRDARFHVSQKQTHVLPTPTLQFLCCQVDIVVSIDGVCMLRDVVSADPT